MAKLEEQMRELGSMCRPELQHRWVRLTGSPVPPLSLSMLRLALGYELQAKAMGGLPRPAKQRLDQTAVRQGKVTGVRPGMRLAREHGGKVHVVTIGNDGQVLWNGREWRSLSEVARAITGTRWSGPAFFGLKQRKAA